MFVIESTQRGGGMFKTRAFEEFITGFEDSLYPAESGTDPLRGGSSPSQHFKSSRIPETCLSRSPPSLRPRSSRIFHRALHHCAFRVRCAIKMKKRVRKQQAQTTFTIRTARGNQQYHCARKPQEISEFRKSLEREYHTISHAWSL